MAKITLTDLTSLANDTSAVNSINDNFQAIEDYINNNSWDRQSNGEVNTLQETLDCNSYGLNNLATINGYDASVLVAENGGAQAAADALLTLTATNTETSSDYTPDFSVSANHNITLTTGANTINNPSTEAVGRSGVFVLIQDGTGSGTVTWGSDYLFPGGNAPTLSTAASAIDVVPYYVLGTGQILCGYLMSGFA